MEWLKQMNEAVNYIEENLSEDIDLAKIAEKACCSSYNFQRMFSFITGVSLAEYIRRRRLTLAAFEIQNSDIKIIETALKYGYETPGSFTRAFQNLHGVTPKSARDGGVKLKAYPRITFQISLKGDVEMNYRIEERKAFFIVGAKFSAPTDMEENFKVIPKIWAKAKSDGLFAEIANLAGTLETDLIGLTANISGDKFDYYIAAKSDTEPQNSKFSSLEVPGSTWAVFEANGNMPEASQNMWRRIFTEWLPTSDFALTDNPEFERYLFDIENNLCGCEIWIPVRRK